MTQTLRSCPASLLLGCIFAIACSASAQTTNSDVLRRTGKAEYLAGNFQTAEVLLRRAIEVGQEQGNNYAVAMAQNDLGSLYAEEERFIEAERAFVTALSIFRRLRDITYEMAVVLRNLGSLHSINQRDSEALKALQEASKLVDKSTPDGGALAAQILNDQGMIHFRKGKISKAEALETEAMSVRSDPRDLDLIDSQVLTNLGTIYQRQRRYAKAIEAYHRSLEVTSLRLGPSHPNLTLTLGNLGILYSEMGRYGDAEDQYRRSLSILEQSSPALDLRMSRTLHFLAKNYLRKGDRSRAEEALSRAVQIARRNLVPDPEMPQLLEAYADVLKSLGRTEEAQRLGVEARRIRAASALTVRVPRK